MATRGVVDPERGDATVGEMRKLSRRARVCPRLSGERLTRDMEYPLEELCEPLRVREHTQPREREREREREKRQTRS